MAAAGVASGSRLSALNLASDDDTEDEDRTTPLAKDGNPDEELMGVADELVVKKVKRMRPFTEDVLTLPDGLQRIHEEFPVSCRFRGRGSEANDVKKLMAMYREWAFQLHPGLSFGDVLSKCDALSGKPKTRACLQDLRDRERDRYIVEVLGVDKSAFEWKEPSPKRSAPAPATASDPFSTTATTATVVVMSIAFSSAMRQRVQHLSEGQQRSVYGVRPQCRGPIYARSYTLEARQIYKMHLPQPQLRTLWDGHPALNVESEDGVAAVSLSVRVRLWGLGQGLRQCLYVRLRVGQQRVRVGGPRMG
mmetsp:Transcript_9663/g.21691  ORF Transcript_9663/g.21691 Transcript_9663/m.21691 type:complete len:306 (-) Transcript_9663:1059-1976(-)